VPSVLIRWIRMIRVINERKQLWLISLQYMTSIQVYLKKTTKIPCKDR